MSAIRKLAAEAADSGLLAPGFRPVNQNGCITGERSLLFSCGSAISVPPRTGKQS
jgi:hypothetical protein